MSQETFRQPSTTNTEGEPVEPIPVETLLDNETVGSPVFVGQVCHVYKGEKFEHQETGNYL